MNNSDYPIFLASEIDQANPHNAGFTVLPVPFEKTVSYGSGTAKGPSAILKASAQLETWDGISNPSAAGIYTAPYINCSPKTKDVLDSIAGAVEKIITVDSVPVVLGGEHTVTYGVISGLINAGIKDIGIIQIDAHADLRDTYNDDPYSHACVMRRIADLNIPIYQLGVRAISEEEVTIRKKYNVLYQDAEELVPDNIRAIQLPDDFPKNVFFTLDIDGIDPSVFPSTGTPVPGGLSWYQTLNIFQSIAEQRNIIGFDLMEFAPIKGFHAYDFSAALLVYKLMGILHRSTTNM